MRSRAQQHDIQMRYWALLGSPEKEIRMDGTRSLVVIHLIILEHFHDIPYLLSICALDIDVICYVSPCAKGCKVCNYKNAQ